MFFILAIVLYIWFNLELDACQWVPLTTRQQTSISVSLKTYQFHVSCASLLVCFGYNFIVKNYREHEVYRVLTDRFPACQPFSYIWPASVVCSCESNFTWPSLQNVDDDGQESSSEGSTVDDIPGGEGGESDFELEESMDPDACFPLGEYLLQSLAPLSLPWQPQS